jgi:sodium/hydrogen exchanger-like protein 6/7/sodium/hydrogen exchanger 8
MQLRIFISLFRITFQSISFIAESIVFVYLGISTIYYMTTEVISFSFLALELAICVISRVTAIFGLSILFKLIFKKWRVSKNELTVVTLAGTIRGSVAFALILTIESDDENHDQVSVIKSTTLIMVCLTTIILGALMPRFINCLLGDPHD